MKKQRTFTRVAILRLYLIYDNLSSHSEEINHWTNAWSLSGIKLPSERNIQDLKFMQNLRFFCALLSRTPSVTHYRMFIFHFYIIAN